MSGVYQFAVSVLAGLSLGSALSAAALAARGEAPATVDRAAGVAFASLAAALGVALLGAWVTRRAGRPGPE